MYPSTLDKIEELRRKMVAKALEKNSFIDLEVIEISEQLDHLIILFSKNNSAKVNDKNVQ